MDRIPFGISRLDELIDGGAPTGSTVLLAGELGAGAREFCYTSAALSALAERDPEQFELYYGDQQFETVSPDEIHYISFSTPAAAIQREMYHTIDENILDTAVDGISFVDLSSLYFERSQVPMEWYEAEAIDLSTIGQGRNRKSVLGVLADYLTDAAPGSLVVIDSMTDLVSAAGEHMSWRDILVLMKGLAAASAKWDGLILLLANNEALQPAEIAGLMDAAHGSFVFEWETGGSERMRTMYVKEFRGVLSQLQEEDIIRFETDIYDAGFDITGVRKIR